MHRSTDSDMVDVGIAEDACGDGILWIDSSGSNRP